MTVSTLVIAALALFVAHTVKGMAGFGSSLVAMPFLAVLFHPADGILLLVCTDLITGAWLLKDVRTRLRLGLIAVVVVGAMPGQWVGVELLSVLDAVVVGRILGGVVLVMGVQFLWRPVMPGRGELTDLPERPGWLLAGAALAGSATGLMVGLVGAGGPPVIAFFKRFFEPGFFRAQLIAVFWLNSAMIGTLLLAKGTADLAVLEALPWVLPPLLVGSRVGAALSHRARPEVFGRVVGLILTGAGIALLCR